MYKAKYFYFHIAYFVYLDIDNRKLIDYGFN